MLSMHFVQLMNKLKSFLVNILSYYQYAFDCFIHSWMMIYTATMLYLHKKTKTDKINYKLSLHKNDMYTSTHYTLRGSYKYSLYTLIAVVMIYDYSNRATFIQNKTVHSSIAFCLILKCDCEWMSEEKRKQNI